MDFPGLWVQPLLISNVGKYGTLEPTASVIQGTATPTSGVINATASVACISPIVLPGACLVRSMYWYNGTTIAGNTDCGIYTTNPTGTSITRLCSTGLVASGTASNLGSANITATNGIRLDPGTYYIVIASSSSTGTYRGRPVSTAGSSNLQYEYGWKSATTVGGSLSATLTTSSWTGSRYVMAGFSRLSAGQY